MGDGLDVSGAIAELAALAERHLANSPATSWGSKIPVCRSAVGELRSPTHAGSLPEVKKLPASGAR
ncbi:hypothetical protein [Propionibacterium sp.]|uniref:hypothetical protein n=1 Tax=Propionibacterium sp. TaxID=1977903 RepID=UPI0039E78468